MGAFYNSFHVRNKTQKEVYDQIVALRKNEEGDWGNCIIGPQNDLWVPVYAETGYGFPLAQALSEMMKAMVLAIDIHDDDVFYYWYFRDGEEMDSFDSCPDYFGEMDPNFDWEVLNKTSPEKLAEYTEKFQSEFDFSKCTSPQEFMELAKKFQTVFQEAGFLKKPEEQSHENIDSNETDDADFQVYAETKKGRPELFADLLDKPEDISKLAAVLKKMQDHEAIFVSHQAQDFCELLHLPEALNSYDYLLEEELPQGYLHITQ